MHKNLGGAVAFDRFWHGADRLQRAELAALGPVAKGGDGVLDFIDDVGESPVWVNGKMPWPGTSRN